MTNAESTRTQEDDITSAPTSLGDFIAGQRRAAEMSLRQLAERAGISNPYVSQIERGLRKPSLEVLHALASALEVSASTLYAYAGIEAQPDERYASVPAAIRNDPRLTKVQKEALMDVYQAFVQSTADPSAASKEQQ